MSETTWQKSSYSGQGDGASCVELAALHGTVGFRESEEPHIALTVLPTVLRPLMRSVKASQYDNPPQA